MQAVSTVIIILLMACYTNIMADLKRNGWHHYQINIIIGIGTTWSACVLHLW